jgi:hypothetical protein
MSANTLRKCGSICLGLLFTLFFTPAHAKERLGSTHAADCLATPYSSAPPGRQWAFRVEGKTQRRCWYLAASSRLKQEPAQRDVSDAAIPLPLPRPRVGTVPTTRDIVTALPAQASTSDERNTQGMATAQGTELNKNSSINATPVPESSTPSAPSADAESVRNQPTADEATEANIAPSIPETSADATHDASDGRTEQRISAPNAPPAGIPPQETAGAAGVSAI